MSRRRFEMYQYRQVLVRMRQGDSDRDIDRTGLMGRKKLGSVRYVAEQQGWLNPSVPLPDDVILAKVFAGDATPLPITCVSGLEPFRDQITAWFQQGIQGTTIYRALRRVHGYAGSYSSVARFLRGITAKLKPDRTTRLDFAPGEAVQVDFGKGPTVTDVHTGQVLSTWVFVMTLCWSRHQYAEFVLDQTCSTWLACHRRAFAWFGGVVSRVIIDNAKCAITRACAHDPEVQRSYAECAEGYGFKIDACPPRDPQKKGIVESGVKYIKNAFVPLREYRSLEDANRQLHDWILEEAGNRIHGSTREQPLQRFAQCERDLLQPLPDVLPVLAVWSQAKVHRDGHIQFGYNLYSVPFRLIGQSVWLRATDTMVAVFEAHVQVAAHARLNGQGKRHTVPDHQPPEAQAWRTQDTQWCLQQAERIGPNCLGVVTALFNDRVLENLRGVQGLLALSKKYGDVRLEAACRRAMAFGNPRVRTVKTILAKGLDQAQDELALAEPGDTYTRGGRFLRDTTTLLH